MRSPNFLAAYAKYTLSYLNPPNSILLNTAIPLLIVLHLAGLHRYCISYKLKVWITLCQESVSASFFQQLLVTSCLCVVFQ